MSSTDSSSHANVVPSEVGWQFVPQYYTFVNKHPNRLHCFYTKASTFIHGTEGEDGKPCHGQQEIHNKITSIGFEDCKVFIHSVDAQSSANGGIIIQVIGEMSNRGEPWRKFVQTFFLAEQPNGYFVLNDIFRFLKEDTVDESEEAEVEVEDEPPVTSETSAPATSTAAPSFGTQREPTPSPQPSPAPPPPAQVEPVPAAPEAASAPSETAKVNGVHEEPSQPKREPTPAPPVEEKAATPAPPEPSSAPAPAAAPPATSAPSQQQPPAATPTAPPSKTEAKPAPSPAPAAPAAPKTWANLAAANSKKWGAAVATDSRGTSEAAAQPATSSAPGSGAQTPVTPSSTRGPQRSDGQSAYAAAQSLTTAQCFVKGVTEPLSQNALTSALTTRFGPIKDVEIVRNKACAFLEFTSLDAAKRAIIASLPQAQGGEGGVRIDTESGQVRITIETRKERGERPVSRPRGGGPQVNGEQRGSYRGGRGGAGGGRSRGGATNK